MYLCKKTVDKIHGDADSCRRTFETAEAKKTAVLGEQKVFLHIVP